MKVLPTCPGVLQRLCNKHCVSGTENESRVPLIFKGGDS